MAKGELTRLLRACSNQEIYEEVSGKLLSSLEERGYPIDLLQRTLSSVPFSNRAKLLAGEKNDRQAYDTFLKVKYSPDLDTRKLRQIITPKETERNEVPKQCLSLNRGTNLSKKLVRAKLKHFLDPPKSTIPITIEVTKPRESNSMPCGNPSCNVAGHL